MDASELSNTREVDEFGNVSYVVHDGTGRIYGRILKTGSSSYRAERRDESYCPVPSIKRGMEWLARYGA
jgi:hypothetical protein